MTDLEKLVMDTLAKTNHNGTNIVTDDWCFHSDYLMYWDFGIPKQQLGGILSSLVKKGWIEVHEEEGYSVVHITDYGLQYYT